MQKQYIYLSRSHRLGAYVEDKSTGGVTLVTGRNLPELRAQLQQPAQRCLGAAGRLQ